MNTQHIGHSAALSSEQTAGIRRMLRYTILVTGISFALYSLVLAPIYTQLSANVLYQNSMLIVVLDNALRLLELAVFFLVYPATIYAMWLGGLRGARWVIVAYALLTAGKYVANFIMTCITDGSLPSLEVFLEDDLVIIGGMLLMELGQYAVAVLITGLLVRRHRRRRESAAFLGTGTPAEDVFPLRRIVSFRNPVQCAVFLISLVMLLGRWFMHCIYQFTLLIYNGESEGWGILTMDLVSDVLLVGLGYLLMLLLLTAFDKKRQA